ncbi:MAG: VWA domain-containing protein, partial [Deltaproteobacteria bacterium]|nr:VWA domain-containing protein [Deltaproteobacteria bacterium]
FITPSCQDYGFEELPSSVIKEKRGTWTISISAQADILFVIDNSGSMFGEQQQLGESISAFTQVLDSSFGDNYQIAIITTGMLSAGCPRCDTMAIPAGCINDSGEDGRFQNRIGQNVGTVDNPVYEFTTDPACDLIIEPQTKDCFYDTIEQKGYAMVGIEGCGYERGLAAIKSALGDLAGNHNGGFLRPNATLAVVVISDEDDCGEVGDVNEGLVGIRGDACYYASKGVDPEGLSNDPEGKPYRLTLVEEYYSFLLGLKDGKEGMVKFAAIVGVKDVDDLSTTTIEYTWDGSRYTIDDACMVANCPGNKFCGAEPGTRYIKLAQKFVIGMNGFVATICQNDFSETMEKLGTFVACPKTFLLSEEILDPDLANILINDEGVPRFSCDKPGELEECSGLSDTSCSQGSCVETWSYTPPDTPPDPAARGGTIAFATHYDPCVLFGEGDQVRIELIYVTK